MAQSSLRAEVEGQTPPWSLVELSVLSYLILRDDASVAGITAEGRGKLPYKLLKLFPFIISPNQFQEKPSTFLQHEVIFIFEATCVPPHPPPSEGLNYRSETQICLD